MFKGTLDYTGALYLQKLNYRKYKLTDKHEEMRKVKHLGLALQLKGCIPVFHPEGSEWM